MTAAAAVAAALLLGGGTACRGADPVPPAPPPPAEAAGAASPPDAPSAPENDSASASPPPSPGPSDAEIARALGSWLEGDGTVQWYGVTMLGRKVGHAKMWIRRSAEGEPGAVAVGNEIRMSVQGTGDPVSVELKETRFYAGKPPWRLVETTLAQSSPAGHDVRRAVVHEGRVVVHPAEGAPRDRPATADSLRAMVATSPLDLTTLAAGGTARVSMFDWQNEEDTEVAVTVVEVSDLVRAGVETRVATLDVHYVKSGLRGRSKVAAGGVVLESTVGPGLVLRLEEEAIAKSGIEGLDVLGASVAVDRPVADPRGRSELLLHVLVPDGVTLPVSPRQTATPRSEGGLAVRLTTGAGAEIAASEREASLRPSPGIDSDAASIRDAARKVLARGETGIDAVRALVGYVFGALRTELATHIPTASGVLAKGSGDCTEHSLLLVALARAAGIAARPVYGVMYLDGDRPLFGWHAWAEVEVDGRWLAVDPTWDQVPADATHLALGFEVTGVGAVLGGLQIHVE